ncbi:RHS repeat-associated core domain-containing protein [Sorangium sp. So ce1151]|uniref:RHS repeat-associated core domain-containing protein n=1 Tax=Sorangium sp. So ce1151 TaxID=3133332 RepID=UPI003F641C42
MARTAPIPNIPAIPGMNPGVWILGGGGAGGGGRGPGGNGNGGDQGGDGQNNGKDAKGGGKSAKGCGQGSGAGCPNPAHGNGGSVSAGDPVDVLTGRVYTVPAVDLGLPGPLPLAIERHYSSAARDRDVGLGFGWSHSLAWEIEQRRRTVRVWNPEGTFSEGALPAVGESLATPRGMLTRYEWGYSLRSDDRLVRVFSAHDAAGSRFRLSMVVDRNDNTIELRYRDGALDAILDSARRLIRVRRHRDGRIAAFEVKNSQHQGRWTAFRTYEYNENGDLAAAVDRAGHAMRFSYDDHLLTSCAYPEGLCAHYRYDRQARCVETWAEYPGKLDESLSDDAPELLADGVTRARGIYHCKLDFGPHGYVEVADSRGVRRYFGNALGRADRAVIGAGVHSNSYDQAGRLTAYTDPYQATWRWERDTSGRVVRAIDPFGAMTSYDYNELGLLAEMVDAIGQATRYVYDLRGNLVSVDDEMGNAVSYEFDGRGQLVKATLPDGGVTLLGYDDAGNRVLVREPNGACRQIRYDYLGRVLGFTDERGLETRFTYGERLDLIAVRLPNGGQLSYEYDRNGRLKAVTGSDRRRYELCWSGLDVVHELRKPDGQRVRYRYYREGALVQVINERGEVHRLKRDSAGRIVEQEAFDGRRARYRLDWLGRIVRMEGDAREPTEITYDAAGRTVERSYHDGSRDVFAYDPLGRLIEADNGRVRCSFAYDGRGRLTREAQVVAGVEHAVHNVYDAMDRRREKRSSLGYVERVTYDMMGLPTQVTLGGTAMVEFRRDAAGHELERILPGGGVVQRAVDAMGCVTRQRVLRPAREPVPPGQPAWVGELPWGTTSDRSFQYSLAGDVIQAWDLQQGSTTFSYDLLGQIIARIPEHARAELFRYDEGGDLHESGPGAEPRVYGHGGKLLKRGTTEYHYDEEGRLIRKERAAEAPEEVRAWSYRWDGCGMLRSIETPDGRRVEFTYDSFARRVQKRISSRDGRSETTRFVWDGDQLLHELRNVGSTTVVEERTYSFLPETPVPLAHRDTIVREAERSTGEWVHYVNDLSHGPELLVSGSGDLLARVGASVWGSKTSDAAAKADTPLRFPGQYAAPETDVVYNRFRYYDPEAGRYISADPIGLQGGLRAFAYADNQPLGVIDPDGLASVITTVTSDQTNKRGKRRSRSVTAGSAGTESSGDVHPIVEQSFPARNEAGGWPYPGRYDPSSCGEPRALSQHIRNWESKIGRKLDPHNPDDHEEIRKCLGSITAIRSEEEGGVKRAPCPNCSQLFTNLHERWGAPDPKVIRRGFGTEQNRGSEPTNFTQASPNYKPPEGYTLKTGYSTT